MDLTKQLFTIKLSSPTLFINSISTVSAFLILFLETNCSLADFVCVCVLPFLITGFKPKKYFQA